MIRSVIRSVIRFVIRSVTCDPVQSDPDFVDAGAEVSRHHSHSACVASVSVGFGSKERPRATSYSVEALSRVTLVK